MVGEFPAFRKRHFQRLGLIFHYSKGVVLPGDRIQKLHFLPRVPCLERNPWHACRFPVEPQGQGEQLSHSQPFQKAPPAFFWFSPGEGPTPQVPRLCLVQLVVIHHPLGFQICPHHVLNGGVGHAPAMVAIKWFSIDHNLGIVGKMEGILRLDGHELLSAEMALIIVFRCQVPLIPNSSDLFRGHLHAQVNHQTLWAGVHPRHQPAAPRPVEFPRKRQRFPSRLPILFVTEKRTVKGHLPHRKVNVSFIIDQFHSVHLLFPIILRLSPESKKNPGEFPRGFVLYSVVLTAGRRSG